MGYASHARYDKSEARQVAYRLWRDSPDTPITQLLPKIEAAIGDKLALRTVQHWRHTDRWDERRAIEELDAAAVFVADGIRGMRVAYPVAAQYLHDVAAGIVRPNALRMRAAQVIVAENRALAELTRDRLARPAEDTERALDVHEWSAEELAAEAASGWEG